MVNITNLDSPKRQKKSFFVATMVVLAKRASRLPRKLKVAMTEPTTRDDWEIEFRSLKSSPTKPKKLLSNISSKTLSFIHKKSNKETEGEEWGDGGVWQKAIIMGGKCEPLDFSGVIYYDCNGKQVNEIPLKSPRAHPVTGYFIRQRQGHKGSSDVVFV